MVGAVFALEASRLARNNRDWHHLVDLCALAETLLIDTDGIYDPRSLNDRLLLGLKGSMAEFELGLLRQRARAAFEQKVRRGFALWEVPVGFIRTEEGRIEKTPDRQVQQAIGNVFQKFINSEVSGKQPSGFVKSRSHCHTPSWVLPERKSSGHYRAAEEFFRF
jgi:DNA invertase Pin-like site-specific DNA recombinase